MRALIAVSVVFAVSAVTIGCASKPRAAGAGAPEETVDEDAPAPTPWAQRRAEPTRVVAGKSPHASPSLALDEQPGVSFERARYVSQDRELLAVIARPASMPLTADTPVDKLPGVVLVHNGFVLTDDTLAWARPFVAAGFVVLMPSFRGENGNPGDYELLRGELDDLKAAARFFAEEPDVDVDRLYAFGHSAGGGLVALLSLDEDQPFKKLATSNGVYAATTFLRWKAEDPKKVPFDVKNLDERTVRALVPNAHEMVHPLVMYVGSDDAWNVKHAAIVKERAPAGLADVVTVPGDHMGSLPEALRRFRELVTTDAFKAPARVSQLRVPQPRALRPRASRSAP